MAFAASLYGSPGTHDGGPLVGCAACLECDRGSPNGVLPNLCGSIITSTERAEILPLSRVATSAGVASTPGIQSPLEHDPA
jgi:hypothetical protein